MSYTEFHKGKIKIVARGDEAIKKYIKDNNLEERINLEVDENTGKIEELEDNEPFNGDRFDHEYHMIRYRRYLPETHEHNPNTEHLLIKYINHEYCDLDDEDIDIHNRVSKDEFEFAISFYNGGTYELEVYEDIISKYDLDEDYEKESESVNITPRESYMILDCLQYALNQMDKEKIDYLFCNYSKDEISKLGQRFDDINLKNRW